MKNNLIAITVIVVGVFVFLNFRNTDKKEIKARAGEVLNRVGLATKGFKYPHELSGGEQQSLSRSGGFAFCRNRKTEHGIAVPNCRCR